MDSNKDEIKTIIEEAVREGKTLHDVALKLGTSKTTAWRWAAKYNLSFKRKTNFWNQSPLKNKWQQ